MRGNDMLLEQKDCPCRGDQDTVEIESWNPRAVPGADKILQGKGRRRGKRLHDNVLIGFEGVYHRDIQRQRENYGNEKRRDPGNDGNFLSPLHQ